MSMSALSAQLAHLHSHKNNSSSNAGSNVGSSIPSSRKHNDVMGRGVQHSMLHGHALSEQKSKSADVVASVLFANPKVR